MIGEGQSRPTWNMESLQRDGLARVKAVDAFRLPVSQNNNTCFCTVSLPTTDPTFNPTPPPKSTLYRI